MFPAYGYKHTYPQGGAQMPADCRYHPTSDGLPPPMKMGATSSPFQFETWPHHYGYPVPTQCHSCCNHNSYPNYYAYRPYPHFPSPLHHLQCYGGYPAYPVHPEPYPFRFAPPPHFTMEPPNYKYDKHLPMDSHCCGCHHHHMHNMKGDKGVKIEEQESEAENKEDSSVPSGFNNIPHPIVWIPPEYKKDQEHPSGAKPHLGVQSSLQEPSVWNGWPPLDYESIKRMLEGADGKRSRDQQSKHMVSHGEKEAVDSQEGPSVIMPQQDLKGFGQEPKFPSGWMPLDMDNLKKLLQNGNLKGDHNVQPMNKSHQMPFPVIWLPHNNEEKDQTRNGREASTASESSSRQHPFKLEQGDDHPQKSVPSVGAEGGEAGMKLLQTSDRPPKTIHVKQVDGAADMKTNNGQQAKNIEERKKSTENGTKSKTTSPTTASKLPPVCLRVDPLPKKKNGQGKTRSPSPPRDNVQQVNAVKSSPTSDNKVHQDTKGLKNEAEKKDTEVPQRKTEINIVDMEESSGSVEVEKPSKCPGDENHCVEQEDVGQKAAVQEAVGKKPEEDFQSEKRILSGTEAATIIQSAYRGYEVRRLEPLKKMRQIANIRDEAAAVKRCIESGTNSVDLKQKAALGETIMNLLLKLDTVQGLHPSIRDFRKSAVKELVNLQEMLDIIEVKQPDDSPDETIEATIQTPDESSLRPGISEAEAGETEVETADESSRNSGLGETEDQHGGEMEENTKDQISTSKELPAEEPSTMLDLLSDGTTPEQALPDKESESDTIEKAASEIIEEAGSPLSDTHAQQNEFDLNDEAAVDVLVETVEAHEPIGQESRPVVPEEASMESVGQESGPVVAEVHVDSADQTDVKHDNDLLAELPFAVLEEDVPDNEVSEPPFTEPAKPELDEVSKGEMPIAQDAESVIPENAHVPDSDGEKDASLTEPEGDMKVGCQEVLVPPIEANDQLPVADEDLDNRHEERMSNDETTKENKHVDSSPFVKPDIVLESDAKPTEDDKSTSLSSIADASRADASERNAMEENERMRILLEKLFESEKQHQEVISSLNEKLKELEGKLAKQRQQKKKTARARRAKVLMPRSCKTSTGFSKESPMALAS